MTTVTPGQLGDQGIDLLRSLAVPVEPGLTESELAVVEDRYGFEFCAEHRAFLRAGLPSGRGWPDWRTDSAELRDQLDGPVDGLVFDAIENNFWPPSWGSRPDDRHTREERAREQLSLVPRLVPVYLHRYLPAAPAPEPAPVLSVHQSDVICYGRDLLRYLRHEFGGQPRQTEHGRPVPFWSQLT